MDTRKPAGFATRCLHAGLRHDPVTGSVAQPIYPSTVFARRPQGEEPRAHLYTRAGNPNRDALEAALADLEGGAAALAFSSGAAAITAILLSLPHGSRALFPADYYWGTRLTVSEVFNRRMTWRHIDMCSVDAVRAALAEDRPQAIWIETPSNPMLDICDLELVISAAHEAGCLAIVDNTLATPVLQNPFRFGADVIVHSATKYMNGHSDVLAGALVFRERGDLYETARKNQWLGGGVLSPHDCWMVRRGLMTMPLRVREHCRNAARLAEWLSTVPEVSQVFYPGLSTHRNHDVARRQMSAFGGVLSFRLMAGADAARRLPEQTRFIANATSLGGVESLMEHRLTAEGPDSRTPADLLRFSVGIEDVDDLKADLYHAFRAVLGK